MADYKPSAPFTVPFHILTPTSTTIKGVPTKAYIDGDTNYFGTFRTFGGTASASSIETNKDGLIAVVDTAILETWYTPQITADCRIKILQTGEVYEVIGTPENIQLRNQWHKVRLQAVKGGA